MLAASRAAFVLLALCVTSSAAADWVRRDEAIMGTAIRVEAFHDDTATARRAADAVIAEMHRIDALMSPYKPESELSKVNARAARAPVPVSRELFDLIELSLEFSRRTEGAFDITFASVGYLYDYRKGVRPDDKAVAAALPSISYRHVGLDPSTRSVRFAREGVRIDLGGIAKGYAVERGAAILRAHGVRHGEVNAGGDTRLLGDRRGRPWMVGVRDPRDEGRLVAEIPLADEAISTSGDYERYFDEGGVRHHHILDPATGASAREVRSVSVIGPDGTWTDALSTSVFVLGVEKGLKLIEGLAGYEAVVVDAKGRLHFSRGLMEVERRR